MSIEIVREEKALLEAAGVDLSGPCGSFRIVERVAWRLRGEGYGLLGGKTPAQNGCTVGGERYSVDWIMKADGTGRDILGDAGGANTPQWGHEEHANPQFYRPALEPMPLPTPPDPGPTPPDPGTPEPPPPFDPTPLLERIAALEQTVEVLRRMTPWPAYVGTGKVGIFGGTFTVRSSPAK